MPTFQKFFIRAYRNGNPIKIQSGSFQRSYGSGVERWQFTTIEPLPDLNLADDTWSLSFSLHGSSWSRIRNAKADSYSGNESYSTGGVTVSGTNEIYSTEVLNYALGKTLVFMNPAWATKQFGNWYVDVTTGFLMIRPPQYLNDPMLVGLRQDDRVFHSRLPGKEFGPRSFEVLPSVYTHHEIGRYLASMMGYTLIVTTPDIPILDTCTIESGTSFFDAMMKNFSIWRPDVKIDGENKIIQVLDILGSAGTVETTQTISIPNSCITNISTSRSDGNEKGKKIDHCIVVGRSGETTPLVQYSPDLRVVDIPEIDLTPNFTTTNDVDFSKILPQKIMDEYSGTFGGIGSAEYMATKLSTIKITMKYFKYRDNKGGLQFIPVEESRDSIDSTGQAYARTRTFHYYGAGYVPVRTVVKDYLLTTVPGTASKNQVLVKVETKTQDQVIQGLKQALSTEITEEKVIYDKVKKQGTEYKLDPIGFSALKRVDRGRDAIETNRKTTQRMLEMTTRFKKTMISRISPEVLIKQDVEFDALSEALRGNSSILINPQKDETQYSQAIPKRWEFFHGTPKMIGSLTAQSGVITVQHDDISEDATAAAIADRVFACRSDEITEVTITTPVPVPIGTLPILVILTSVAKKVNTSTGNLISSTGGAPSGRYYGISLTENFRIIDPSVSGQGPGSYLPYMGFPALTQADPLDFTQTIQARSKI